MQYSCFIANVCRKTYAWVYFSLCVLTMVLKCFKYSRYPFSAKKTVAPMVAAGRGLEHAAGWAAHAAVSGEAAAGAAGLWHFEVTSNAFW